MKKYKIFIALMLFINVANAQYLSWIETTDSDSRDDVLSAVSDEEENIYVSGYFEGELLFELEDGEEEVLIPFSSGADAYVAKCDRYGNFIWAKSIRGSGGHVLGNEIIQDGEGNLYITGQFAGTADFDPGDEDYFLSSSGDWNSFLLKLDPDGNFVWVLSGIASSASRSFACATDDDNNIYWASYFLGEVDFNFESGMTTVNSEGADDGVLIKVDADGNLLWMEQIGATGADAVYTVEVGNDNAVYIGGYYSGTVDLGFRGAPDNYTAMEGADHFISRLDTDGFPVWTRVTAGTGDARIRSITSDELNNVYFTGTFNSGTVDFDPGDGVHNLTAIGGDDCFISKLNADGNFEWVSHYGSSGNDRTYTIKCSDNGTHLMVAGRFYETVDFDPGETVFELTSSGYADGVALKFDNEDGALDFAFKLGGEFNDYAKALVLFENGAFCLGGSFSSTTDFDPAEGATEILNPAVSGSLDGYIARYRLDEIGVGIHASSTNDILKVYPNPFNEIATVDIPEKLTNYSIQIHDLTGRLVYQQDGSSESFIQINRNDLGEGVFLLRVFNSENTVVATTRLVTR